MSWVVSVYDSANEVINVIGPFASEEAAEEFAIQNVPGYGWTVDPLDSPESYIGPNE